MALGNIYSDPNYHNLNHWAILQTLARKGVYSNEASDAQLTETTLIQTNPLRMVRRTQFETFAVQKDRNNYLSLRL